MFTHSHQVFTEGGAPTRQDSSTTTPVKPARGNNVELSGKNPNFITPDAIAAANVKVFGQSPDLDPASSEIANQVIGALSIFTPKQNGLKQRWGRKRKPNVVYLNPPGMRLKQVDDEWIPVIRGPGKSSQSVWLAKFREEHEAGRCWGIYLSFNPEPVVKAHADLLKQYPHCWFRERPCFQNWDSDRGQFVVETSPRKHCLTILLPPPQKRLRKVVIGRYMREYAAFGECIDPKAIGIKDILDNCDDLPLEALRELQGVITGLLSVREEEARLAREHELSEEQAAAASRQELIAALPPLERGAYGTHISERGAGYIDKKFIKSADGKRTNGPYYALRWREGGKYRMKYLGRLDPSAGAPQEQPAPAVDEVGHES